MKCRWEIYTRLYWQSTSRKPSLQRSEDGQVVIATGIIAKAREDTTAAFKKKYGINVEWILGRPSELEAKIKSERNIGLSRVDLTIPGTPSIANVFKPMGITLPIEPLLVLPEVTDVSSSCKTFSNSNR